MNPFPNPAMIRFAKTFVILLGSTLFAATGLAQTPGSVAFNTTLVSVNGKWGTKHYVVAWVTKADGTFIKTLWKQGKTSWTSSEWTTNCPSWNTARGGSSGSTAFDGYTSATAPDYSTPVNNPIDPVWNCRDASNNLVPDGDYKFWVQYGHSDAAGPVTTNGLLWTKRSTAFSTTFPNTSSFTGMSIAWTPATVAPAITSPAPPASGVQGVAYSHTMTASGSAPVTFSVTSGALPPPLTLSPAGVISGTPNAAGLFTGTITAANGTSPNATQNFSITIAPAIVITSAAPPATGNVGVAYSHTCTATGSGTISYAVSSGALPTGLVLSPSGVISGTPEATGTFTGVIRASNGIAPNVTQNFSITIAPAVVATPGTATLAATLGPVWGGEHWWVAWVTKDDGTFIKTLRIVGNSAGGPWDGDWGIHCATWDAARNGSMALDGYTAATAASYAPPDNPIAVTWNGCDASCNLMPDGTYKLWIQYSEDDDSTPGPVTTNGLTWTKGASATTANPPAQGDNFTNLAITWKPVTAFGLWAAGAGLGEAADPTAAPHHDGVTHLQKFAFNLDPSKADAGRLVVGAGGTAGLPGTAIAAGPVLRMEFIRRKASTNPGITYTAQFGSDFTGWTTVTAPGVSIDDVWERVVVVDDPPAGSTKRFGRVKVTQP
jgi:hypothetical protein